MNQAKDQCATIVLVGHCGADGFLLRNAVTRAVPEARIERVDDQDSLAAHLQSDRLLLINRVLGGDFDEESGIELIRRLRGAANPPRLMLISNYPEAQQAAVEAGAPPGFGKRNVNDAATVRLLREACSIPKEPARTGN
jgi:hypothetical protein